MRLIIRSSRAWARFMCLLMIVIIECAPAAYGQSPGAQAPTHEKTFEPAAELTEAESRRGGMTLLGSVMGIPPGIILGLGGGLISVVAQFNLQNCSGDQVDCGHAFAIFSRILILGSAAGGGVVGGITGGIAGYQASNPEGGPQGARYLVTPTVTGAAIGLGIGLIGNTGFCLRESAAPECLPEAAAMTALLLLESALVGLGSAAGPGALIRHLERRRGTAVSASLELSVMPAMFAAHRDGPRLPGLVLSGRF